MNYQQKIKNKRARSLIRNGTFITDLSYMAAVAADYTD